MKNIVLLTLLFLSVVSAFGQTGDFQLKNLQERPFKKISGNPKLQSNGFKRFLIGENYRKEWGDTVRVPVLNLKTDYGGLTPEKEGGGKQTHTLHLKDGSGRDWVLRSVEKFPEKVIAPELRGTIAETLVKDGISASYPYSVLSVGTLAKAAGIPYLPNTVVYIPDDPKLGEFTARFKNTLALLELRTINDNKEIKSYDTEEIIPELQESNKKTVDQKTLLKVRLLDNFIMDFDRYESQWLWVEKESNGRSSYYAIPKDRDQAFFNAEGFLPKIVSGKPALGPIQGLRAKPKNILTFNYSARNFDRTFLNELDEQAWSNEIDHFLSKMTDDVIENAVSKQPKEIQKFHSEQIATILKDKRASFKKDMLRYYRFLSNTVSIVGSNDAERFIITKNTDGKVKVEVQDRKEFIIYNRLFNPVVTKEIRIYGLRGDDQFLITGDNTPIKIRIIGGPGDDSFTDEAKAGKVLVYDVSFEDNKLSGNGLTNKISSDPLTNDYRRISTEYNSSSIGLYPEYSTDGGLFLGPSYTIITHGFRKDPYASKHFLYATKALSSSAWHLHYDADFMSIGRNTDLLLSSDAKLPTVRTHFFGYGNNTAFDKLKGLDYYKLQYTLVDAALLVRHKLASWLYFEYGPLLEYFKISPEKNSDHYTRFLYPSEPNNLVYGSKWYSGGLVELIVDTRNNKMIPTMGIRSNIYSRQFVGLNENANLFNETGGAISFYTDVLFKKHIILATSFGGNHNFGEFEIPQAQYLGLKQNLRGYRFQRFAGRSRAYNNSEVRINFGDVNFYLFKGPLGVIGFHDIGRVWTNDENTDTWHRGYGGGFWLAPFNKTVMTALLTSSKEEKAFPMVTFGFQF